MLDGFLCKRFSRREDVTYQTTNPMVLIVGPVDKQPPCVGANIHICGHTSLLASLEKAARKQSQAARVLRRIRPLSIVRARQDRMSSRVSDGKSVRGWARG